MVKKRQKHDVVKKRQKHLICIIFLLQHIQGLAPATLREVIEGVADEHGNNLPGSIQDLTQQAIGMLPPDIQSEMSKLLNRPEVNN